MTAREVLDSALKLLGYNEANGNTELPNRILMRAIPVINVIYSELKRAEGSSDFLIVTDLCQELELNDSTLAEIMPAGVAMMIAASESDGDSQSFWAEVYYRKKAILTRFEERADSLPIIDS